MIGRLISHYKVVEQIGAGGMGIVYKAEDTRLGRFLALKFLPADASQDQVALERFQREARAASAFNHPSICTIYDIGEYEGRQFIAMELLDGHSLDTYIGGRPLPIGKVLDLGIQIADALDAAHGQGILHRDIKPANIFVTSRGLAKVLDFGLAKLAPTSRNTFGGATAAAPTVADRLLTTGGLAVGTVAYMSPEQARGEDLDARSDLFSFGVVLHEMATGRQAFQGNTTAVVFDAILNRMPPPATSLNPEVPPELERIIDKAIEKDRTLRFQTAADARSDLQRLKRARESGRNLAGSAAYGTAASGDHVVTTASGTRPLTGAWPTTPGVATSTSASTVVMPPTPPPTSVPTTVPTTPAAPDTSGKRGRAELVGGVLAAVVVVAGIVGVVLWRQMHPPIPEASVASPASTVPEAPKPIPATRAVPSAAALTTLPTAEPSPGISSVQAAADRVTASARKPAPAPSGAKESAAAARRAAAAKPVPSAPAAALPVAKASPEIDPVAEAVDAAGVAIRAGEFDQALARLQGALGQKPGSPSAPEANLLIAHVYERQHRLEAATAAYAEVKNRYPRNAVAAEALLRLAGLAQQTKDPNRAQTAVQYLTDAVTRFPDTAIAPLALSTRAGIEERENMKVSDPTLGRSVPAALVSYRQLAERYPTSGVSEAALWKLASFYEDLKRFDLAAESLAALGTRFPATQYDAWWEAADLYEKKLKDKDKARAAYLKVPSTSRHYRDAQKKAQ